MSKQINKYDIGETVYCVRGGMISRLIIKIIILSETSEGVVNVRYSRPAMDPWDEFDCFRTPEEAAETYRKKLLDGFNK